MRASRLISMLLLLQARGRMTAQELADELEVTVRTVYRDALSLQAAGVPLHGEPGHEGGYRLVGGYRTDLTGLSAAEASALLLTGLPEAAADLGLGESATTVRRKLIAALPAEQQRIASRVAQRFHLDAPGWYQEPDRPAHLAAITQAVLGERRVRLRYSSWDRDSTKTLHPYGLVLKAGCWYLVAATPARPGRVATYRVDQMSRVRVLDDTFVRPEAFGLAEYWGASVTAFRSQLRAGVATVRLSPDGLVRARQLGFDVESADPVADGWATATIAIESITHAHGQLLQLGADVEVLEPPSLRALLAGTTQRLAALYAR